MTSSARHRARPTRPRIVWWFLIPLLTGGLATAFVVAQAGRRLRNPWIRAAAVGYFLLFLIAVVMNEPDAASPTADVIVTVLFLVTWLVGTIHTVWLEIRVKFDGSPAEPTAPADPVVLAAQRRLARRNEARSLLTTNPALAAELRIGRPDLARQYDDGGLVDINHVPAEHIARELGIPLPVAEEIVRQRERVGGFYSADDLIVRCDKVAPYHVAPVRDRLLCLHM